MWNQLGFSGMSRSVDGGGMIEKSLLRIIEDIYVFIYTLMYIRESVVFCFTSGEFDRYEDPTAAYDLKPDTQHLNPIHNPGGIPAL